LFVLGRELGKYISFAITYIRVFESKSVSFPHSFPHKKGIGNLAIMSKLLFSAVGIATGYGLDGRGDGVVLHVVQTVSGAHPASYPMCTGGSFPGGKATGE
jgi:hypothetical protein